jgi:hypothetical protein
MDVIYQLDEYCRSGVSFAVWDALKLNFATNAPRGAGYLRALTKTSISTGAHPIYSEYLWDI